jgi:hypothetical protein
MKISEAFALDSWLSYFPEGITYEEIIDAMTSREHAHRLEHIDVWEIVEDLDYSQIAELIENTRTHFEQNVRLAIEETGYKKALQELLDYTGGSDITNKDHPIYKACMLLAKEQTI